MAYSYFITQETLGPDGKIINLNVDRRLHLTIANLAPTGPLVTVVIGESSGNTQTFTVNGGAVLGPAVATIRTVQITGEGATIFGILSSSPVNQESLLAMSVPISGTVDTDIGQRSDTLTGTNPVVPPSPLPTDIGAGNLYSKDTNITGLRGQLPTGLDANGFFKTRYLGASDVPNRGWNLGSGDVPGRGWTLGSGDVPSRGWTLGSGDVPGRGWNLGSTDVPGRGWALGSGDIPGRGWNLGSGDTLGGTPVTVGGTAIDPRAIRNLDSSDVPSRSWTLGSSDTPVLQGETPTAGTFKPIQTDASGNLNRSWTLGSGDTPSRSWALGSGDAPGRSWALGSGDVPGRGWALGASDVPGRGWTLGSGDSPARSWTLGSGDVPGRGWALGSGDVPGRGWALGSGDVPGRGWTLGSGDTPNRSWTLGSGDAPKPVGTVGPLSQTASGSLATQADTTENEDQSGGPNVKIYNPWGYSGISYPVRAGTGNNNNWANVQQSGARGYIYTMSFYCINPTAAAINNQTLYVNLYRHLPTNGPSSPPVAQFNFTISLAANSNVWISPIPNIYWPYDSLVVVPQQQGGTTATKIVVANPTGNNNGNSHYWNGNNWNSNDVGFIGYWTITNTAPTGVPVQVMGGEVTVNSGLIVPEYATGSIAAGATVTVFTCPTNYRARLIGGYITASTGGASVSLFVGTSQPGQRVIASGTLGNVAVSLFVGPTSNTSLPTTSFTPNTDFATINITDPCYLFPGEVLSAYANVAGNYSVRYTLEPLL